MGSSRVDLSALGSLASMPERKLYLEAPLPPVPAILATICQFLLTRAHVNNVTRTQKQTPWVFLALPSPALKWQDHKHSRRTQKRQKERNDTNLIHRKGLRCNALSMTGLRLLCVAFPNRPAAVSLAFERKKGRSCRLSTHKERIVLCGFGLDSPFQKTPSLPPPPENHSRTELGPKLEQGSQSSLGRPLLQIQDAQVPLITQKTRSQSALSARGRFLEIFAESRFTDNEALGSMGFGARGHLCHRMNRAEPLRKPAERSKKCQKIAIKCCPISIKRSGGGGQDKSMVPPKKTLL